MNFELHIRFYDSASRRQNMWVEAENCKGKRYEINSIEEAKNSFEDYINNVVKRSDGN